MTTLSKKWIIKVSLFNFLFLSSCQIGLSKFSQVENLSSVPFPSSIPTAPPYNSVFNCPEINTTSTEYSHPVWMPDNEHLMYSEIKLYEIQNSDNFCNESTLGGFENLVFYNLKNSNELIISDIRHDSETPIWSSNGQIFTYCGNPEYSIYYKMLFGNKYIKFPVQYDYDPSSHLNLFTLNPPFWSNDDKSLVWLEQTYYNFKLIKKNLETNISEVIGETEDPYIWYSNFNNNRTIVKWDENKNKLFVLTHNSQNFKTNEGIEIKSGIYFIAIDINSKLTTKIVFSNEGYLPDSSNLSISPDGKFAVFTIFTVNYSSQDSRRKFYSKIYLIDLEKNIIKDQLNVKTLQKNFSWTPDSKYFSFSNLSKENGPEEIYSYSIIDNKSEKLNIFQNIDDNVSMFDGSWSPDGTYFSFASNYMSEAGFSNIFILNLKTREIKKISSDKLTKEVEKAY